MKRDLKICIRVGIDTTKTHLPCNLEKRLSSVKNLIHDTEEFYKLTDQYLRDILCLDHPVLDIRDPQIQDAGVKEEMHEKPVESLHLLIQDKPSTFNYKGVSKDVDESS